MSSNTEAHELAATIGAWLKGERMTLAIAESCTGGLLGTYITDVPGSSEYFLGGVVAYSYDAKEHLLGVRHNTLYEYGAVSRQCAIEMAQGARRAFRSDFALAVTGIAGPGGGTPDKPVGLVFIALSTRDGERCEHYVWSGNRQANKEQSVLAALRILNEQLTDDD